MRAGSKLWLALGFVLAFAAIAACVAGGICGTLAAKIDEDPATAVEEFFYYLEYGEYADAYNMLADYSTLGLENTPTGEKAQEMAEALLKSYSHSCIGACIQKGLSASQQVEFTALDLGAYKKAAGDTMQPDLSNDYEKWYASGIYTINLKYVISESRWVIEVDDVFIGAVLGNLS